LSLHETRHVVARREIRRYFANVEPNRRGTEGKATFGSEGGEFVRANLSHSHFRVAIVTSIIKIIFMF
jgi:hypothetical protein